MMRDDLDGRITQRLRELAPEPSFDFGERLRAAVADAPQRGQPWSLRVRGSFFGSRRVGLLIAATVVLVALTVGAIVVASGLIKLPSPPPVPPVPPEASAEATPGTSSEPSPDRPLGMIVYNVTEFIQPPPDNCTPPNHPWCTVQRIWIANSDGTSARELLPDVPGDQNALGWTPDGSRLLYLDSSCQLRFADAEGTVLETQPLDVLYPSRTSDTPCDYADLSAGFAFSPDGTRLAYVLGEGDIASPTTVIAIYDLDARQVTRLVSTGVTDTGTCVTANEGRNLSPVWSPDGSQLLFQREPIGPLNEAGGCQRAVLVVNADGTDLRVVVPPGPRRNPGDASWSPAGSLISYHYAEWDALVVDIFVVNPDGTGVRQLTTDGLSAFPMWTADGRIVFGRFADATAESPSELWIMDADGGGLAQLQGDSLADLVAPACVGCPYANPDQPADGLRQPLP
jgi:hypothetical protein